MYLSIDSYSETLGLCLLNDEKIVYRLSVYKNKPFSETIVSKLDKIFKEENLNKKLLKGVIVNKGVGGYTGLRVGISVAKTIAYALNISIYSYETLETLAFRYRFKEGKTLVCINAGKGEAYYQIFLTSLREVKKISEINLIKQSELKSLILEEQPNLIISKNLNIEWENIVEDNEDLAYTGALYSLLQNKKENLFELEPLYIRKL